MTSRVFTAASFRDRHPPCQASTISRHRRLEGDGDVPGRDSGRASSGGRCSSRCGRRRGSGRRTSRPARFPLSPSTSPERLEDAAGIRLPAAEVVDLARRGRVDERLDEAGDVEAVDVVADLLALVAEDPVLAPLEVALHEVAQEAVQLDAAVVRPGQAAAAEAAGRHAEVAAVLLHHHVRGDLARAEEAVEALVDRERLGDALRERRVGVVPARLALGERDRVRPVAVDLVRAQVDERPLGTVAAGGLEEVQRADGVGVEVVERDVGGPVVRGLRGGVDDRRRAGGFRRGRGRPRGRGCRARGA